MQSIDCADNYSLPSQYVLVTLNPSKPVSFGGTEEPAAYGELLSIGAIGGEKNKAVCNVLQLGWMLCLSTGTCADNK